MAEHEQLFNMCREGKIEEVRKALARGGDPNKRLGTNRITALHAAAAEGHREVVALLLEQSGVDLNAANNNGWTALHHAAAEGHEKILALLLDHPGIDDKATSNGGSTILHSACYGNCGPDILRRLLTNPDTDPNVKNLNGNTPIMILLQRNNNMDIQRVCLQAMVESDKVDLDVKDPEGRGLEDLAR